MTEHFISEAFRLLARIKRAGYVPSKVWKLYKHLRGELHINPNGSFSRSVCTKERKPPVERESSGIARYGNCVECLKPLTESVVCKECGYDNYWEVSLRPPKKRRINEK